MSCSKNANDDLAVTAEGYDERARAAKIRAKAADDDRTRTAWYNIAELWEALGRTAGNFGKREEPNN